MQKHFVSLALASVVASLVASLGCEPAIDGPAPGFSPASGALALTDDDRLIVIAAEDHDAVLVIDRESRSLVRTVAVADAPSHLIVVGREAIVSSRYGHMVSVVDIDSGTVVRTIATGAEPIGLTAIADGVVAVALAGEGAVAVIDTVAGVVVRTIALSEPDPRAVALLADGTLYVSHMATGKFSRVNPDTGAVRVVDVTTRNDFGVRLIAEHQRSLTVDESTGSVVMAHSQANADTVRAPIGGLDGDGFRGEFDDEFSGGGCGYSGCPSQLGAVVPGLTEVDVGTDSVVVPTAAAAGTEGNTRDGTFENDVVDMPDGGGFFGAAPPSVLNPFDARFNGVQLATPTAVALFDGGRGQLVINEGSKNALLLRRNLNGTASDVLGAAAVGNGAIAVVLSHDGRTAYVWNQFDAAITELEVPVVESRNAKTRFADDDQVEARSGELTTVAQLPTKTWTVTSDALEHSVSVGRKMFFDATDTRISASATVSCGSCHPDGRTDGRTWQFTFGPRNTPQLGGDILDTAPFHWPGDVATVAALNEMTVKPFMGGKGLDPADFEFVAAFIGTIRQAPAAAAARLAPTDEEALGKIVFESDETGCVACHSGAHFTDNGSYDVASRADERDIRAFQTPVLHGLQRSAPYFHDGKYATLEDLVEGAVRGDTMGTGSHLNDIEARALVAFLKTL